VFLRDSGGISIGSYRKSRKGLFLMALVFTAIFWLGLNAQPAKNEVSGAVVDAHTKPNVILLGWDGVQRNHLFELLERGLMPNLRSFLQNGAMVNVTVSDHYTDTKAGWTQILTGYKWWKTGVFNNIFWFHSIPRGSTIPERLENIYGKDKITTAFITGKINHMETINGDATASIGSPWAIYTHEAIYSNLPSQLDLVSAGNPDNGIYNPDNDRYADVVGLQ
jgi:hypothetical protein